MHLKVTEAAKTAQLRHMAEQGSSYSPGPDAASGPSVYRAETAVGTPLGPNENLRSTARRHCRAVAAKRSALLLIFQTVFTSHRISNHRIAFTGPGNHDPHPSKGPFEFH